MLRTRLGSALASQSGVLPRVSRKRPQVSSSHPIDLGPINDSLSKDGIDCLVFDIDDTLYPVTNGFTNHRLTEVAIDFMVSELQFRDRQSAADLWREYFGRYHSTVKALTMADRDGALPAGQCFDAGAFSQFLIDGCNYSKYLTPDPRLAEALFELQAAGLKLVIFTNAPRAYGIRVLEALEIDQCFEPEYIFGVEDVMPLCKPERAAFEKILTAVGSRPEQAVMFEDSLKNVRGAKAIGMKTVLLLAEEPGSEGSSVGQCSDRPDAADPAVDIVMSTMGDLRDSIPSLWNCSWL